MVPARLGVILLASFLLASAGLSPALAQQGKQRKVFTNEDVARPAPAAPAAETPAEKAEAAAEKTPTSESTPAAPPAAEHPAGSQGLSLAQNLHELLRRSVAEYSEKLDQETDPSRQERWGKMIDLIMSLMTQNQIYISELESTAKAAAPAPESAPPPPTNPESPSSPSTPPSP